MVREARLLCSKDNCGGFIRMSHIYPYLFCSECEVIPDGS